MTKRLAEQEDVIACYNAFLGRQPESNDAIHEHLKDRPTIWTLISRFRGSEEARRRQTDQAAAWLSTFSDSRNVEVIADSSKLDELIGHIQSVWSRYGKEDPYFSVLTNPKYLSERLKAGDIQKRAADMQEFYGSGKVEVDRLDAVFRRNKVTPDPAWRVLELGCGVGRMGEPFARRYVQYMGVDISAEHLALARGHLLEKQGVSNVQLQLLPDFLERPDPYDLFFSIIVLQHNPPPIMHMLLDHALNHLAKGGYAYFQVPCFMYGYSFSVSEYLAGQGRLDHMEMHALPQQYIFALFDKHGVRPIEVVPDERIGPVGISYSFLAQKS